MLVLVGFDNRFKQVSPSFERVLGWTKEEVISKQFYDFLHPDDFEKTQAVFRAHETGKNAVLFVNRYRCKDGSYRWISWNSHPLTEKQIIVGIGRDITDRRQAEEALRLSEERFSKVFRLSPFAVIITRYSDGTYIDVNDTFLKMFEYSRNEVIGHTANEIKIYANPNGRAAYLAAFKNGRVTDFEVNLKTKTGKQIKALGFAEIINVNGQDLTFGTLVDITERKKTEETLGKKQDELQTIIDSSQGLIFYKDRANHFIRVNKAFAKIMGLPKEQLEGRSLSELYPKEEAEAFWSDDKQVIASGKAKVGIEEKMQSPQGQRWVQTDKIPYRDAEGNIIGVIGFSVDITERKKAEESLQKAKEQTEFERKRLETILETTPSAVVIIDAHSGKFSYVNKRAAQLYGFDTLGLNLDENVAKVKARRADGTEYPIEEMPVSRPLKFGQEVHNEEMIIERADGHVIPIVASTGPLRDMQGNITAAIVVFEDITERKKVEESLRESEERLRFHAENTPLAVVEWDSNFVVTRWAGYAEKLFGWSASETLGLAE